MHEALIVKTHRDRLVGHLSRDSTAIEAREKPTAKEKTPPPPKRKRGRPKKGEQRPKVLKRLDRQATMTLPAMLDELPTACDVGMKKDSKGYKSTWVGYKLHIDVADGQIPISCLLTSASLHDSQAAIPLATLSAERTTNLYDVMDAAYDAEPIRQHSRSLGHVPLIDTNPRRDQALAEELRTEARRLKNLGFQLAEQVRYNERTAGERVNGRLKDEFGGRHVRVRGAAKVMCHCMRRRGNHKQESGQRIRKREIGTEQITGIRTTTTAEIGRMEAATECDQTPSRLITPRSQPRSQPARPELGHRDAARDCKLPYLTDYTELTAEITRSPQ